MGSLNHSHISYPGTFYYDAGTLNHSSICQRHQGTPQQSKTEPNFWSTVSLLNEIILNPEKFQWKHQVISGQILRKLAKNTSRMVLRTSHDPNFVDSRLRMLNT